MNHDDHLRAVDAALEEAAREAGRARLDAALRARILARARAQAPAPRGRVLDLALRSAAAAAAAAAVVFVAPVSLEAAESPADALRGLNERISESVLARIGSIEVARALPEFEAPSLAPLAAACAALLAAGAWTLARRREP